jgi:hypothetical protein
VTLLCRAGQWPRRKNGAGTISKDLFSASVWKSSENRLITTCVVYFSKRAYGLLSGSSTEWLAPTPPFAGVRGSYEKSRALPMGWPCRFLPLADLLFFSGRGILG